MPRTKQIGQVSPAELALLKENTQRRLSLAAILLGILSCGPDGAVQTRDDSTAPIAATPADEPAEAREARMRLVSSISSAGNVKDSSVLEALSHVQRHEFIPQPVSLDLAYEDRLLPIGPEQTLQAPSVVARLTDALQLAGSERVLLLSTDTGYQAAVLALLCRHVDSVESNPKLAKQSRARMARLGFSNVAVHSGDSYNGWPAGAPYDRILLTAAPFNMPSTLVDQLAPYGILVGPIGSPDEQQLVRWRKMEGETVREELGSIHLGRMGDK